MRPALLALLTALLGLSLVPSSQSPASASCTGPELSPGRIVLVPGSDQTVSGGGFRDGCADTMSCPAFGCGECEVDDPESPTQDVELRLLQAGRRWKLGTADADEDYRVTWTFVVPSGVAPGRARLLADGARPVVVRVR